jgi:hypothetical protein
MATSKRVAKKASKGLKSPKSTKTQKSIDASALAQTKHKPKPKKRNEALRRAIPA